MKLFLKKTGKKEKYLFVNRIINKRGYSDVAEMNEDKLAEEIFKRIMPQVDLTFNPKISTPNFNRRGWNEAVKNVNSFSIFLLIYKIFLFCQLNEEFVPAGLLVTDVSKNDKPIIK